MDKSKFLVSANIRSVSQERNGKIERGYVLEASSALSFCAKTNIDAIDIRLCLFLCSRHFVEYGDSNRCVDQGCNRSRGRVIDRVIEHVPRKNRVHMG